MGENQPNWSRKESRGQTKTQRGRGIVRIEYRVRRKLNRVGKGEENLTKGTWKKKKGSRGGREEILSCRFRGGLPASVEYR